MNGCERFFFGKHESISNFVMEGIHSSSLKSAFANITGADKTPITFVMLVSIGLFFFLFRFRFTAAVIMKPFYWQTFSIMQKSTSCFACKPVGIRNAINNKKAMTLVMTLIC
jgi:hypothetical protein